MGDSRGLWFLVSASEWATWRLPEDQLVQIRQQNFPDGGVLWYQPTGTNPLLGRGLLALGSSWGPPRPCCEVRDLGSTAAWLVEGMQTDSLCRSHVKCGRGQSDAETNPRTCRTLVRVPVVLSLSSYFSVLLPAGLRVRLLGACVSEH